MHAPLEMVTPPVRHEHYYDRPKATDDASSSAPGSAVPTTSTGSGATSAPSQTRSSPFSASLIVESDVSTSSGSTPKPLTAESLTAESLKGSVTQAVSGLTITPAGCYFLPGLDDKSLTAPGIATAAFLIPGSQSVAEVITDASTVDAAAVAKMATDCTPFMLSDSTSGAKATDTVDKGTGGPSGLATTSITRTIDDGSTKASETFIIARAKGATAILAYSFGPTDPVSKAVGDATNAAALAKLAAAK